MCVSLNLNNPLKSIAVSKEGLYSNLLCWTGTFTDIQQTFEAGVFPKERTTELWPMLNNSNNITNKQKHV